MRYLCVHCDHRFEDEGDDKPRCPKCMRVHGIEKIGKGSSKGEQDEGSARKPWLVPAVVVAVLAALGGGYALWASDSKPEVEGDPPLTPLSDAELEAYLDNAGVAATDAGEAGDVLAAADAVQDWADDAAGDAGSANEKAEAIVGAMRARASKQAFVSWSLYDPRDGDALHTPAETLKAIGDDDARSELYPLEAAAIAVRALRSQGVEAMVAEAWGFEGDKSPPDPSGRFGYYVVAVYEGEAGKGKPTLLDPWGGRATAPGDDEYRVLTDVQTVAAGLNHLAVHRLVRGNDVQKALDLSEKAVDLDERSPTIRTVHGMALVQAGGLNDGLEELEAAAQLRPDSPRHLRLAEVQLAQGNVGQASNEIAKALEQHPDYAAAHAMLAAVHLGKGETDMARSELEMAEKLDANVQMLPVLWSQYYMRTGEMERAVEKAREAIERRRHDWQTRLQAAAVFRQAGYYEDMRKEARAIMDMVPESRRKRVEQLITQVLGPTALEEPLALGDGGLGAGGPDGGLALPSPDTMDDMDLSKGSKLLGDGEEDLGGGGPSLGGGGGDLGGGTGGGDLQLGGGGSKLRLRDPGESFDLDLGGSE